MSLVVQLLTPDEWARERFPLLRFVRRHGESRCAKADWLRLVALRPEALAAPGTAVAVVRTAGGMAAGLAFAAGFGEDACVFAVHPALRGRGIGRGLLARLAAEWGRLGCRVAADNAPGLAACFAAGLVAVGLERGPTGKPALRLRFAPGAAEPGAAAGIGEAAGAAAPRPGLPPGAADEAAAGAAAVGAAAAEPAARPSSRPQAPSSFPNRR